MKELYQCPMCGQNLDAQPGTSMDPKDGITVFCPSHDCPAQEVSGHGGSVQSAFKIIEQKFNRKFQTQNEK